jgi:hypothetical protein
VYQDGADTVQACSPTRTATGAFMANPTQVLIGIPARVNAGAKWDRKRLLHDLLHESGSIYVHLDWHTVH